MLAITTAKVQSQTLAVADSLFAIGNYSEAIKNYQNLESPKYFKIAKAQEALGQDKDALKSYDQFLVEHPKDLLGTLSYSKLLIENKAYKKGDSLLLNTLKDNFKNAYVSYQLGLSKQQQGDTTAVIYFQMAGMADPQFLDAKYQAAKHYIVKRKFAKGKAIFDDVLETDSTNIRFLNLKALYHYHQKEYHDAIKVYKKLSDLGESTEQLLEHSAVSYEKTFQYEKAIPMYKQLITNYDNQNAKWHYQLGRCYFIDGNMEKAQDHFRMSLLILDQPLDTQYFSFAMTYMEQKNYKKAIKFLKIAIEENSENKMAYYQLAVAADNYYEDKNAVLNMYQRYIDKFGTETNLSILVKRRMSDLKKELHFNATEKDN